MSVTTVIESIGRKADAAGETCNPALAEGPWAFDGGPPTYGPGASQIDVAPPGTPRQGDIPARYKAMTPAEVASRIEAAKAALGERLVILGHHYQRDEVIRWADFRGDSYRLARLATTKPEAEFIVFCGVHFMAETADILSRPDQVVILPNLAAGCSMADMADEESVLDCWARLGPPTDVVPVTYMNSSAALKAFCGERGGIVCTSSNARRVLDWAFAQPGARRALFFPDQHLGRNTGRAMGIPVEQMPLWDPRYPTPAAELEDARVILWRGWCSVHQRFTVEQVARARAEHPGVKVMVHPECPMEVVDVSDLAGSTEKIVAAIENAPAGSVWAIGTEINLVRRLQDEHPDQTIFCLDPVICPCSTMYRIHPAYLAWVLEGLVEGDVQNEIRVPPDVAAPARIALERMLAVP